MSVFPVNMQQSLTSTLMNSWSAARMEADLLPSHKYSVVHALNQTNP